MKIPSNLFEKWYQLNQDEPGLRIACGLPAYDDDTVPRKEALKWFERRKERIQKRLDKISLKSGIPVYRCMEMESPEDREAILSGKCKAVGEHWTIDRELVKHLCGGTGGKLSKHHLILEGICSYQELDITTLFNPNWSDTWEEFEVVPKKKILVTKVWNGDFSELLSDFGSGKEFKTYGWSSSKKRAG